MESISLGITELNREFNGGIRVPSITAFKTRPDSKVQKIYNNILDGKDAIYISFVNPEIQIKNMFEETDIDSSNIDINQVDGYTQIEEDSISEEKELLFIESFEVFEDIQDTYKCKYDYLRDVFSLLYNISSEYDLAIVLDISKNSVNEAAHDYTYRACDNILELDSEVSGKDIDTYLTILKSRFAETNTKRVKLQIEGYDITVDPTRELT